MNTKIMSFAVLLAAATSVLAADAPSSGTAPEQKKEHREIRIIKTHEKKQDMELATFLGVITSPVSPELTTQLGLPECTGLLVMTIMDDSPAASALKRHDILLKLDDQILIETRQLAVLVRSKKDGDEVTFTVMRLGKQETVKVKLGKKEMPKLAYDAQHLPRMMQMPFPHIQALGADVQPDVLRALPQPGREDTERILGLLHEAPGSQMRIIEHRTGAIPLATMLAPGRSTMVFTCDTGSIELTINDGKKSVVAKDNAGKEIFSGPVNTPEEMKAVPAAVREKLEKVEAMDDFGFQTDQGFGRAERFYGQGEGRKIKAQRQIIKHLSLPPAQVL